MGATFVLLAAMTSFVQSPASAEPPTFTLVSPVANQKVNLAAKDNWYLPISVRGTAPGMDSLRFRAVFYDATGEAASVSWYVGINRRIDTAVDWTFKLGISNLTYVENPVSSNLYQPSGGRNSAELVATRVPFKTGTLKPGTYAFQLFVTNTSWNIEEVAIGDVAGLKIGTPSGVKCAPGSFSKSGTWTTKTACSPSAKGYVVSAAGAKSQTPVPAGSFTPRIGAASSYKCVEGTYQPRAGQSTCVNAALGNYVAAVGSTKQEKCPVGKFAPSTASFNCLSASPGNKVPAEGSPTQTKCPIGTYQPNWGKSFCTSAARGYFVPDIESINAIPCEPGTYQNETGKGNCKNATPGHYVSNRGSAMQYQCSAGTYSSFANSISCDEAPLGYYVSTDGAASATACPAGMTTASNRSISLADCYTPLNQP